jgi:hypothetical protein
MFTTGVMPLAGGSGEARLVLCGRDLVAVLVKLSSQYGGQEGRWFIEAGSVR